MRTATFESSADARRPGRGTGALLLAAVACAVALTACHDGPTTPPLKLPARYALESVGDSTLPYVLYTASGTTARMVADTLLLDAQGHATQVGVLEIDSTGSITPRIQRNTSSMTYQQRFDTLYFDLTCPPNASLALCAVPPVGWLLRDGRLQLGIPYMNDGKRVFDHIATYHRVVFLPDDRAP